MDQPRGHDRQAGPRRDRDPRRRRVRHRAGAGLPLARRRGDADRGRAPAAPHRGGVRLRAGHRRARRARRRRPHRPQGRPRSSRTATRCACTWTTARPSTPSSSSPRSAATRAPRSSGSRRVGLEGGGYVEVDENMQVPGHDWLYAIGDVNGRILLTHMGKYQARLAAEHILGNPSAAEHGADGQRSPRVVFTDPQVAAVGHTEKTAREAGLDFHILEVGTSANAGGSFYGRDAPGTSAPARRQGVRPHHRRHDHRLRGRRLPPRRHDRDRRRGPDGPAVARHAVVPDPQRDLAEPDGRSGRRRRRAA